MRFRIFSYSKRNRKIISNHPGAEERLSALEYLAKNVFQLHGIDRSEKLVWRRKLNRANWLKSLRYSPADLIPGFSLC